MVFDFHSTISVEYPDTLCQSETFVGCVWSMGMPPYRHQDEYPYPALGQEVLDCMWFWPLSLPGPEPCGGKAWEPDGFRWANELCSPWWTHPNQLYRYELTIHHCTYSWTTSLTMVDQSSSTISLMGTAMGDQRVSQLLGFHFVHVINDKSTAQADSHGSLRVTIHYEWAGAGGRPNRTSRYTQPATVGPHLSSSSKPCFEALAPSPKDHQRKDTKSSTMSSYNSAYNSSKW